MDMRILDDIRIRRAAPGRSLNDAPYHLSVWASGNDREDVGNGPQLDDGVYKGGYDTLTAYCVAQKCAYGGCCK